MRTKTVSLKINSLITQEIVSAMAEFNSRAALVDEIPQDGENFERFITILGKFDHWMVGSILKCPPGLHFIAQAWGTVQLIFEGILFSASDLS